MTLAPPEGLVGAALAAWQRAVEAFPTLEAAEGVQDGLERYARAVGRSELARVEWEAQGSPLVLELANGVLAAHPLLKVVQETERDAARFCEKVWPKRAVGRPKGSSPLERLAPASQRLRAAS